MIVELDLIRVGVQLLFATISCFLIEKLILLCGDDPKQKNRRWYLIHSIVNGIIVLLTFSDLIASVTNPMVSIGGEPDTLPMMYMISLHLYHILGSYDQMTLIDWLHHLISGFFVGFLSVVFFTGTLINYTIFFMCGLPGGIDYLLLSLVKYRMIDSLTEKGINVHLNMWIRLPGILYTCFLIHLELLTVGSLPHRIIGYLIAILLAVNGIYFSTRVVRNYGEHLVKREHRSHRKLEQRFHRTLSASALDQKLKECETDTSGRVDEKTDHRSTDPVPPLRLSGRDESRQIDQKAESSDFSVGSTDSVGDESATREAAAELGDHIGGIQLSSELR